MIRIHVPFVVISAFVFSILGQTARAAPDRVALVIGNGRYVNAGTLQNPPNDARAVGKALAAVGFDVVQGVDLDRVAMENLLRAFLTKATDAKVALLFYAGHGLQVDGRNYLIPVDAKLDSASDLNFGTIDLDKILGSLDDPARANIIILDACRDNPMARSFASRSRSTAVGAGLAAYSSLGTGTLIAFSTAPGKVARDGQGTNSPFTASLVKYLGTPGLEVRQMLTRVRAEVAATTGDRQVPWDNSSLRGDVYLAGLSTTAGPSQQPPPSTKRPNASPTAPVADPVTKPTESRPDAATSQPSSSDAAQAWTASKDTTSPAVLQAFIRRYRNTVYGEMASARLKELQAATPKPPEKVAVAAPDAAATPSPSLAKLSLTGSWHVFISEKGDCGEMSIVQGPNGEISGKWNFSTFNVYRLTGSVNGNRVTIDTKSILDNWNLILILQPATGGAPRMEGKANGSLGVSGSAVVTKTQ